LWNQSGAPDGEEFFGGDVQLQPPFGEVRAYARQRGIEPGVRGGQRFAKQLKFGVGSEGEQFQQVPQATVDRTYPQASRIIEQFAYANVGVAHPRIAEVFGGTSKFRRYDHKEAALDATVACGAKAIPRDLVRRNAEITDANAAFFDAAHNFFGCIAGLHEVLRRQGLLEGSWCLNTQETLSPGQKEEIDRVYLAYPHLHDDDFVRERRDQWQKP
jgi:hypothetical protein